MEELSSGEAAQRTALSSKLDQLEYEAKRAFEQYDVVDARNRPAAAELERRWNEKLKRVKRFGNNFPVLQRDVVPFRRRRKPAFFLWASASPKSGMAITAHQH
jgi:hypothetical protein